MTRLALLALAALLVAYAITRPKWRWEERDAAAVWEKLERIPGFTADLRRAEADLAAGRGARYSTSSPYSVTSRADNGTGFDPRLMGA